MTGMTITADHDLTGLYELLYGHLMGDAVSNIIEFQVVNAGKVTNPPVVVVYRVGCKGCELLNDDFESGDTSAWSLPVDS